MVELSRATSRAGAGILTAVTAFALAVHVPAAAAPEQPPPDPAAATSEAGRVGELTSTLAAADAELVALAAEVEVKMEDANKARVDLSRAERAARDARRAAAAARAEADAAAERIERQRRRIDEFAASSYRQGSALGSVTAFAGTGSPEELLARAEFLDVISRSELGVLERLERVRADKVNRDSLARGAAADAERKRAAAERARRAAEAAERTAIQAQAGHLRLAERLAAGRTAVEAQLADARAQVSGLAGRPGADARWPASLGMAIGEGYGGADGEAADPKVEAVIRRALSQLGVIYAWGGGNASGPTKGIRDGGVADANGDFAKVGFDCSGLMLYAFAAVGVQLDHYSGYQYESGRKIPLDRMRRGDMIFWRDGASTHHVALYLGGGKMVEAPYSGARVRVTDVRYGGIAPFAVRMF
ncbi:NlpC/P60 family protein [Saccharopolyspora erythraea NRRL 2338]|uniref:Cell wall-associated hydrolase n=2 Tax=Saccharopolyspora erythraea TaxID=1836 RepID=A4FG93_SACEN|nr:NlpC/P60 family protein [Saccharopolyspora erythraea]PFG96773.1 NlpC/P60 family protein [Saccharopolyspora erythraea NRRL 2338]CAM03068.1 cell wall-associated hydrolase [Saccharopolyspora erythraea NRRL 2338]